MRYKRSKETYEKLIEVSTKLFYEKGFDKTKIREICRRADINHSLIYYYFPDGKHDIAFKLIDKHKSQCLKALKNFFRTESYLLYTLTALRFTMREIMQDEKDLLFYIEAWSKFRPKRALVVENYTAALQQSLDVDSRTVEKATLIGDSVWSGLYRSRLEGILEISHKEIRDATDIARWMFMGLSKDEVKSFIDQSEKIVEEIPIQGIRLLDI